MASDWSTQCFRRYVRRQPVTRLCTLTRLYYLEKFNFDGLAFRAFRRGSKATSDPSRKDTSETAQSNSSEEADQPRLIQSRQHPISLCFTSFPSKRTEPRSSLFQSDKIDRNERAFAVVHVFTRDRSIATNDDSPTETYTWNGLARWDDPAKNEKQPTMRSHHHVRLGHRSGMVEKGETMGEGSDCNFLWVKESRRCAEDSKKVKPLLFEPAHDPNNARLSCYKFAYIICVTLHNKSGAVLSDETGTDCVAWSQPIEFHTQTRTARTATDQEEREILASPVPKRMRTGGFTPQEFLGSSGFSNRVTDWRTTSSPIPGSPLQHQTVEETPSPELQAMCDEGLPNTRVHLDWFVKQVALRHLSTKTTEGAQALAAAELATRARANVISLRIGLSQLHERAGCNSNNGLDVNAIKEQALKDLSSAEIMLQNSFWQDRLAAQSFVDVYGKQVPLHYSSARIKIRVQQIRRILSEVSEEHQDLLCPTVQWSRKSVGVETKCVDKKSIYRLYRQSAVPQDCDGHDQVIWLIPLVQLALYVETLCRIGDGSFYESLLTWHMYGEILAATRGPMFEELDVASPSIQEGGLEEATRKFGLLRCKPDDDTYYVFRLLLHAAHLNKFLTCASKEDEKEAKRSAGLLWNDERYFQTCCTGKLVTRHRLDHLASSVEGDLSSMQATAR